MALAQTLELFSRKRGTYTSGRSESIAAYRFMREGVRAMRDFMMKRPLYGLVAAGALMTACAASPQATTPDVSTGGPIAGTPAVSLAPFTASGNAGMDTWRADFASRAVAAGRDPAVVHATLEGISPLDLYLGDDASIAKTDIADQAEFAKPIWDYVKSAVTVDRKTRGADRLSALEVVQLD